MALSGNEAWLCGTSNASSNQQHTKIVMLFINLIYFPSIKSTLLGFPKIVIDALVLFPSLDVSTLKVKKNQSYDLT